MPATIGHINGLTPSIGLYPNEVNQMTRITPNKGGTSEQVIDSANIDVPDLWHVAMAVADAGDQRGSDMIIEC